MLSLLRISSKAPRARVIVPSFAYVAPRRFASSDYGSDQSGHQQDSKVSEASRKLEHPGPETPASQGKTSSPSSSSQSSASSSGSGDAQPAIHRPKSAAEDKDPEVRKHNEEMEQRHERSVNQLSEKDNKVDKQFWKGDVGKVNTSK